MFHRISNFVDSRKFFILENLYPGAAILSRVLCMHRDNAQAKRPHKHTLRGCDALGCVIFGTRVDENYKQTQQQTNNLRNPPIRRLFRHFRIKRTKSRVWSPCCLVCYHSPPVISLSRPAPPAPAPPSSQLSQLASNEPIPFLCFRAIAHALPPIT